MKLTFVSNYFNHHQQPLCDALAHSDGVDFTFVQTEPMEEERVAMGWGLDIAKYPYVLMWQGNEEKCRQLIMESDALIWGGVETKLESELFPRLDAGGLTYRYSERIYKEGQWKFLSPRGLKRKLHDHTKYRKAPYYLLCAGAYVASDYSLIHAYKGKMLHWGYFPEVIEYSEEELHEKRKDNERLELLWSGRMLDWKHPELCAESAAILKENGIDFRLRIVGGGGMEDELKRLIKEKELSDKVEFLGYMQPMALRELMREADIYLFTSDYREGWGVSVNEAMNAGCALLASHAAGAVPSLIKNGENGLVFWGAAAEEEELESMLCLLAVQSEERRRMGSAAYAAIWDKWRPEHAAGKLLAHIDCVRNGKEYRPSEPGEVLSPAPLVHPGEGWEYTRRHVVNI